MQVGMIFENQEDLKERIETLSARPCPSRVRVTDVTSDYMGIYGGTVLRLEGNDYFVLGEAREGRFGIDDQPKFWVKYALDLSDGSQKIIKLVFHEEFTAQLGAFKVRCVRDPDKESKVLEIVDSDERFMQGRTVHDKAGNNVRIIDRIRGKSLYTTLAALDQPHEEYFHEELPGILRNVADCIDGLEFLRLHDQQHGDVRNDHILIEAETGKYRWIDFDYTANYLDYDIWSVGNILTYVTGRGIHTCKAANRALSMNGTATTSIGPDDALLFHPYRLANLRKLFPYLPEPLNELLMRFSTSTLDFYEEFASIARDLRDVVDW